MGETASTLDHFLDPLAECFTPDVAQRIADLRTDERTRARLDNLRVKTNDGTLSASEQTEYEELVEGLDLLSILNVKARAILQKHRR